MGIELETKYDEKSCGVVVFRNTNKERLFLVLLYPGRHWDFPKGHVELNETEIQTAKRELEEETGIKDITLIDGYREQISYIFKHKKKIINKEVIYFLGETKTKEIQISHEHIGHKWLPYDEAFNKVTFENAKNLLSASKKYLD